MCRYRSVCVMYMWNCVKSYLERLAAPKRECGGSGLMQIKPWAKLPVQLWLVLATSRVFDCMACGVGVQE